MLIDLRVIRTGNDSMLLEVVGIELPHLVCANIDSSIAVLHVRPRLYSEALADDLVYKSCSNSLK